jgi:hypothetical protein
LVVRNASLRVLLAALAAPGCATETVPLDPADACVDAGCVVRRSYGELGRRSAPMTGGTAERPLGWKLSLPEECGEGERVELQIELHDGRGVFSGQLRTGTYALVGDELDRRSCGACVELIADQGTSRQACYFATGGTLALTTVSETELAGTLASVRFAEVACDQFRLLGEACTSWIDSLEFVGSIAEPD